MSFMKSGKRTSLRQTTSTLAPSWFTGTVYKDGDYVTNRFTGRRAYLDAVSLSMYDYIMGSYVSGMVDYELFDKCKEYIMTKNPEAYMKLLD